MIVTLIGMMGSGKSTVGRLIAEILDYKFYDTDSLIVKKSGREINDIFRINGEEYFRNLEKEIIIDLYNQNADMVVATGGGAILSEINRNIILSNSLVYWLNIEAEKLADRLYKNEERPLINDYKNEREELINHLDKILDDRIEYYQIGQEIDGDRKPSEIAREIINDIRGEVDIIE